MTLEAQDLGPDQQLSDKALDEASAHSEEAVEESLEDLAVVGDELEMIEGENIKLKAAYRKGIREAAKDRKSGKERNKKLDRSKLLQTKAYRTAKAEVLLHYTSAFETVLDASRSLVPLQSARVENLLVKCLSDSSERVQESALYALAQVALPQHVPTTLAVAAMMSSPDDAVRSAAGLCLGEIAQGLDEGVDALLWLLDGQGANGQPISSDHKRGALNALALMMRSRFSSLTRLRQKAMEALNHLQDGDAYVREAAKRLSGYIARQDDFGLEGFRCQVFLVSPLCHLASLVTLLLSCPPRTHTYI